MSEEVEKIMDLVADLALDRPSLIVQNTIKVRAAVEALVAERDDWKRAIMERRNSIARILDEKANERREREADRQRFPDPAFNEWLDEGISDFGHTVWDATENIADAWAGWNSRGYYRKAQLQQEPQERECECCNGTGTINEKLGGEWNSNPAAKCPDCDGAGVWEAKAQVQQEQRNVHRLMHKINGEFIPASEFFTGEPPSDWVALVNTYPGEWGIQRRVTGQQIADGLNKALAGAKAQVQQESYLDGVNIDRLIEALTEAGCASGGHEETAARLADYVNRLTLAIVSNGKKIRTQVQQEPMPPKSVSVTSQEPVGTAVELPAAPAWTTACFESAKVPVGAKIYAAPVSREPTCKQDLQVEAQVQQEALFLLHTGKFYDGGQDEWEIEADSYNTVSAFCHAHPEQTIGLYAAPVNYDKLREAVQKALELAYDGSIESLIEVLEAMK